MRSSLLWGRLSVISDQSATLQTSKVTPWRPTRPHKWRGPPTPHARVYVHMCVVHAMHLGSPAAATREQLHWRSQLVRTAALRLDRSSPERIPGNLFTSGKFISRELTTLLSTWTIQSHSILTYSHTIGDNKYSGAKILQLLLKYRFQCFYRETKYMRLQCRIVLNSKVPSFCFHSRP